MLTVPVFAAATANLTDARYFAALEVAYLGFPLNTPNDFLQFAALREWVQGPQIFGERNRPLAGPEWEQLQALKLDGLVVNQVFSTAELAEAQTRLSLPVWLEFVVNGYTDAAALADFLAEYQPFAQHFVLNFTKGGIQWDDLHAGRPFPWSALAQAVADYPLLLEIEGPLPQTILQALPGLRGFSLRGGQEEKVGFKDYDDLEAFFSDLEMA